MKNIVDKLRYLILFAIIALYAMILLKVILFKYVSPTELLETGRLFSRSVNVVPFISSWKYFQSDASIKVILMNLAGNIGIFVPMGLFMQMIGKNKGIMRALLCVALISFGFEVVQYAFGLGASDIDDIILNTIGGLIGIFIYRILAKVIGTKHLSLACIIFCVMLGLPSIIYVKMQYPYLLPFFNSKAYTEVIVGEEHYINFRDADIDGELIGYQDGILEIRNSANFEIGNFKHKYFDDILFVELGSDSKISKIHIEYGEEDAFLIFEPYTMDELSLLEGEIYTRIKVSEKGGNLEAEEVCLSFGSEIN